MFRIAYVTAPQAGQRWTLMKQCGVEASVGGINPRPKSDAEPGTQYWSYRPLVEARAKYESGDIPLEVIEARPADEKIKLGVNGRDSDGWINECNEQADFEKWSRHPETTEPIRRQFPNPKRPRSSQQAAIEALVKNIDQGTQPLCPGEYGREALEIAIALRESDLRGSEKMELPLANRSLKSG